MSENFRVRMCSDLDYEEMVVDIVWKDVTVATITNESTPSKMIINIYRSPDDEYWTFSLDEFVKILEIAKRRLCNIQNKP